MQRGHHGLDLKIFVESVEAQVPAEATHLVASVREVEVEIKVAVYPDDPRTDRSRDPVCHVQVICHDPRC